MFRRIVCKPGNAYRMIVIKRHASSPHVSWPTRKRKIERSRDDSIFNVAPEISESARIVNIKALAERQESLQYQKTLTIRAF